VIPSVVALSAAAVVIGAVSVFTVGAAIEERWPSAWRFRGS